MVLVNYEDKVQSVMNEVKAMTFRTLIKQLSKEAGYKIGCVLVKREECGFWNPGVKDSFSDEQLLGFKLDGRMNSKGEILWFWDRTDMEEILISHRLWKM